VLPGHVCPGCGTAAIAAPPSGAHAGPVSYGPALNAAAVVLTSYGNVPPERAAHVADMLLGVPVSSGWVDKAGGQLSRQLERAGFEAAMCAALAAEPLLAADQTPVNVLAPGAPAQGAGPEEEDPEDGDRRAPGTPHVLVIRTPGRAADLAAGPGVTAEGGRHRRGAAAVHRVLHHRRVQGPASGCCPGSPASSSYAASGRVAYFLSCW
jgi:Transposase IS66 family